MAEEFEPEVEEGQGEEDGLEPGRRDEATGAEGWAATLEDAEVAELAAGFYLLNCARGQIAIGPEDGLPIRLDRRWQAQRLLATLDPSKWAILEVTIDGFPWVELLK